jgi:alkanesulfonate monooxygenase SsuD/methylene tetrahydromethanopterin reductase-like flavin-dependent oxidoreductase (luciferase family)
VTLPVDVGIYLPQIGFSYADIAERTRWVEELGFHSLWLFDHLFFEGPPAPVLEGWTLASALLAETERLRVGHLVTCNNFRHPVLTAKMAATLDAVSGGRFVLGMGSGSVKPEHDATGLPWGSFDERTGRLAESLEIVTRMLRGETVTHAGRHYAVTEVPGLPAPREPIPLVLGGGGAKTLDLVARYADWWNCPTYNLDDLEGRIAALRAACETVGRDPSTVRVTMESVLALAPDERSLPEVRAKAERRFPGPGWGLAASDHVGTPDMVVEKLRAAMDLGVSMFVFFLHDRLSRESLELLAEKVVPGLSA